MTHLVVTFPQMFNKLFNFLNKAKQNASELRYKQDRISAKKGIYLICFLMAVQEYKLEFKVFSKILLEIRTEVIQYNL
jgi:hypothetical protein